MGWIIEGHIYQQIFAIKELAEEEAIDILKVEPWKNLDLENELSFIANKLGYETSELKEIMNQPGLWYKDYPNNEFY